MGHVKENLLTKGFSGKIGDEIVFRQVDGRTIFSKRPKKRTTFTPRQTAQQTAFQKSVFFARTVLISPTLRADYAQMAKDGNLKSVYRAAITDYLTNPKIASLYTDTYKGAVADTLLVASIHEFKIIEARFTIKLADNMVLETGLAIRSENGWLYTVQKANANFKGCKVLVTIKDRLNKTDSQETVL